MSDLPEDSKLTRSKQAWAEQGRFLTGRHARPEDQRLPPGQHLVTSWPVLDLGVEPTISTASWRLDIGGLVETKASWNWDQFNAQPQVDMVSDIHCVTSWSRYDNRWGGVSTRQIVDTVKPAADARFVLLGSYDGYATNVAIEDFLAPDALVATSWEGQPLTREHGGPARLVIPHLYFWKSAKWLSSIEFVAGDKPGFWEVRGYHNHGDPWTEQRYSE